MISHSPYRHDTGDVLSNYSEILSTFYHSTSTRSEKNYATMPTMEKSSLHLTYMCCFCCDFLFLFFLFSPRSDRRLSLLWFLLSDVAGENSKKHWFFLFSLSLFFSLYEAKKIEKLFKASIRRHGGKKSSFFSTFRFQVCWVCLWLAFFFSVPIPSTYHSPTTRILGRSYTPNTQFFFSTLGENFSIFTRFMAWVFWSVRGESRATSANISCWVTHNSSRVEEEEESWVKNWAFNSEAQYIDKFLDLSAKMCLTNDKVLRHFGSQMNRKELWSDSW